VFGKEKRGGLLIINYVTHFPKPETHYQRVTKGREFLKTLIISIMKKIKIENYREPVKESIYTRDKRYWISLGNGARLSFTNRKDAKAFLARTNRFLNERVFDLNRIYVDVFSEYRRIWFYFDDGEKENNERIELTMHWTNVRFNVMIRNAGYESGNAYAFQNLRTIISNLLEIIATLRDVQKRRNNWVERYNLEVLSRRLTEVDAMINGYGLAEEKDEKDDV
jgi:hypothetical protein